MKKSPSEQAIREAKRLLDELKEYASSHEIPIIGVMEINASPEYFDNSVVVSAKEAHYFRSLVSAQGDLSKFLINLSKTETLEELDMNYTFH
ncbi:hypothetical protein JCM19236_6330 [Vibrio sp. JCM 19236]|nr:hypothetical protein JCM19236_6330 [Vibrio sp. JCM 19236]